MTEASMLRCEGNRRDTGEVDNAGRRGCELGAAMEGGLNGGIHSGDTGELEGCGPGECLLWGGEASPWLP